MQFDALRLYRERSGDDEFRVSRMVRQGLDDLDAGEVVIRSKYAAVNYKDARAVTGDGQRGEAFSARAQVPRRSQALEAAVQLAHESRTSPSGASVPTGSSVPSSGPCPDQEALRNELRRGIEVVSPGRPIGGEVLHARPRSARGLLSDPASVARRSALLRIDRPSGGPRARGPRGHRR